MRPKKASQNKKSYIGNNAFPGGQPICKPSAPGRTPKKVGGPIHPGIANLKTAKAPTPMKPLSSFGFTIQRSDQNNDIYSSSSRKKSTLSSRSVPKKSTPKRTSRRGR